MKKNQTMFSVGVLLISTSIATLCFSSVAVVVAQSDAGFDDYADEYGGMMDGMGGMGGMGGGGFVRRQPSPLERQIKYLKKARTDEQKETVKQRIRKELVQQYDGYLAASADELKNLEARLEKLRGKLSVRKESKEKMIDLELQRIVNEAEGLAWPKKMNKRSSSSTFGGMGIIDGSQRDRYVRQGDSSFSPPVQPKTSPRNEVLAAEAETKPKSPVKPQTVEDKTITKNSLRQIGLSSHNFVNQHQLFPRNIEDEIGTPMLSWRVAILPYLGEKDLYEKFHLNEAWDSPHNKKLLSEMPSIYGSNSADGKTNLLGIADTGGIFEPGVEVGFAQIIDGSSNTVLCVAPQSADQNRFWTEPSDLTIDQFIDLASGGNMIVGISDGAVFELNDAMSRADLRHLAIRNDGEVVTALREKK